MSGCDPTCAQAHANTQPERETYEETPLTRVYFAIDHDKAQVKIGVTSDVDRRLTQLKHDRGHELDLIGSVAGGRTLEDCLHARFAPYRREGREWYTTEILPEVQTILAT